MNTQSKGFDYGIYPIDPTEVLGKKIDRRLPWRPFPTKLLRGVFRDYVQALSRDMDADESIVANMVLGLVSGAIGTRWFCKVHPPGCGEYRQPAFLWIANVVNSGGNKSGVFQAVLKIAQAIDGRLIEQSQQSRQEYQLQLAEWETGLKEQRKLWRKAPSESDRRELTRKYMARKPKSPRDRRFLTGNATTGAIQLLLKSNPHGLLCAYDELRGWVASMGQFSKSSSASAAEKSDWLSMWNGGRISVDRKSLDSPSIVVNNTGVSLVGSIQTSVLKRMVTTEDRENGLLTRILTVWPPSRLRLVPSNVTDAAAGYSITITNLLNQIIEMENYPSNPPSGERTIEQDVEMEMETDWQSHKNCWNTPAGIQDLCLSNDALREFIEWQHANERARDEETDELIKSLHPKVESHVLRFALIDHVCLFAEVGLLDSESFKTIGIDSIRRGIQLAEWFFHEQKRVYAEVLDQPEESIDEQYVRLYDWIDHMTNSGRTEFRDGVTSRQVQRAFHWSAEVVNSMLDMMSASLSDNLLLKTESIATNHKTVVRYQINPDRSNPKWQDLDSDEGDTVT